MKRRRQALSTLALASALCCTAWNTSAQSPWEWARNYRLDPAKTNEGLRVATVPDGVIVAGNSSSASGDSDYLIVKYKTNGDQAWVRRFEASPGSEDVLRGLAVDPHGNVFVTGTSKTVKFSNAGDFVWAAPFGGRALIANQDFVYVTGFSETDWATVQLANSDGQKGWLQTFDGALHDVDISETISFAPDGDIVVGGWEIGFRLRGMTAVSLNAIRYLKDGGQKWVGRGILGYPGGPAFALRLWFDGVGSTHLIGADGIGLCITQFDSTGTMVENGSLGSFHIFTYTPNDGIRLQDSRFVIVGAGVAGCRPPNPLWGSNYYNAASYKAICASPKEEIYITGMSSSNDLLLMRIDPTGTLLNSALYRGPSHLASGAGSDLGKAITTDSVGNVYVTGASTTEQGGTEIVTLKFPAVGKLTTSFDGSFHVQTVTSQNQLSIFERTSDFLTWENLGTFAADTNGIVKFDDATPPSPAYRFYRSRTAE